MKIESCYYGLSIHLSFAEHYCGCYGVVRGTTSIFRHHRAPLKGGGKFDEFLRRASILKIM